MELRRLRYFVVLARELHYGHAAERLNITQPGLSQQIKMLEREVGVDLFQRDSHSVSLTEAGSVLLREAELLLRHADEIVMTVRAAGKGLRGRLRLVHTRSAPESVPHALVQAFRTRFPQVEVFEEVAWTARNVEMLRSGEADAAFVRMPLYEAADIDALPLASDEHVVAIPAGHRLSAGGRVRREDLRDEPVVLWPRRQGAGYYDHIKDQVWDTAQPRVILEEPDAEHILAAVASGIGITILDITHATKLRPEGVQVRRFAPPVPTADVGIAWVNRRSSQSALGRFVALCRAESLRAGALVKPHAIRRKQSVPRGITRFG